MNNPYLRSLELLLQKIPYEERMEILQDYLEHFRLAEADGKTPDEIAQALGDPEELAKEILAEHFAGQTEPEETVPAAEPATGWRRWEVPAAAALILLALIVWVAVASSGNEDAHLTADTSPAGSPTAEPAPSLPAMAPSPERSAAPSAKETEIRIDEKRAFPSECTVIELRTVSQNIRVEPGTGNDIEVAFEGSLKVKEGQSWQDYVEFVADRQGTGLNVSIKPKPGVTLSGSTDMMLRVKLPSDKLSSLKITTVSGHIKTSPLTASVFQANTVSGDVNLDRINGDFEVHSISGDIALVSDHWSKKAIVSTVSGNVNMQAEEKLSYTFELTSVSGGIEYKYPEQYLEEKRKNRYAGDLGDQTRSLVMTTVSGRLFLEPAKAG